VFCYIHHVKRTIISFMEFLQYSERHETDKNLTHVRRQLCHFSLSCVGEGNGNPLQCSCLENPRDGGAWWAAIYRVAQSRTRLKWLSSSSGSSSSLCYMVNIILYFTPWAPGTQKMAVGYILDSVTVLASVLLYIGWRSWTCSGFLCHSKLCNQRQVI